MPPHAGFKMQKPGALLRVHGPLAIWFYPIFCRLRRLYHRIFVRQQSGCTRKIFAKQEGMEKYESSKYLLTIPYPVCILRIMNNVHVEVIG